MKFIPPSQLDQQNPGTWPIYYKLGVWILIVAVAVFLYNQFVYSDFVTQQESNQSSIRKLENQFKTKYQYHLDLPLYQEQQKAVTENLLELLGYLPSQLEISNIIDQIYDASYHNGLNFASIVPQAQIAEKFYNVQPIALQTTAGFDSFSQFIEEVNKLPRIIALSSFNLTSDFKPQKSSALTVNSQLETYVYNQDLSAFGIKKDKK